MSPRSRTEILALGISQGIDRTRSPYEDYSQQATSTYTEFLISFQVHNFWFEQTARECQKDKESLYDQDIQKKKLLHSQMKNKVIC